MESEENIYSKEFIERLNNQNASTIITPAGTPKPGFWLKISLGVGLLLLAIIVFGLSLLASARSREKITFINELSAMSLQSHEVTKKYQDAINDVKIRVVNEHFNQSMFGLNNDLKAYTDKAYDKEQAKKLTSDLQVQKEAVKLIFERLHKADLRETLARTYLQELNALLDQNITAIHKVVVSGYYNKDFTKQMESHYTQLLSVQKEIQALEEEKAKK